MRTLNGIYVNDLHDDAPEVSSTVSEDDAMIALAIIGVAILVGVAICTCRYSSDYN